MDGGEILMSCSSCELLGRSGELPFFCGDDPSLGPIDGLSVTDVSLKGRRALSKAVSTSTSVRVIDASGSWYTSIGGGLLVDIVMDEPERGSERVQTRSCKLVLREMNADVGVGEVLSTSVAR